LSDDRCSVLRGQCDGRFHRR